jgi:hypothetical protein
MVPLSTAAPVACEDGPASPWFAAVGLYIATPVAAGFPAA